MGTIIGDDDRCQNEHGCSMVDMAEFSCRLSISRLVSLPGKWFATSMPPKKKTREMSDDHKAALAEGRSQGRAVRVYLEAIAANKPKRGRKRTADSIAARLDAIAAELVDAEPLKQLQLTQEQLDLQAELETSDVVVDLSALETAFIEAAGPYAKRKGIGYAAFRSVGVTPAVLRSAGISRGA